ncbi:MAG: YcxB family protein [Phycisphaerales bacterium]
MDEGGDPTGGGASFDIAFELTAEDIVGRVAAWLDAPQGVEYIDAQVLEHQRHLFSRALLYGLATVGGILLLVDTRGGDMTRGTPETLAFALVGLVVAIGVYVSGKLGADVKPKMRAAAISAAIRGIAPGHIGPVRVHCDAEGATWEDAHVTARYPWPAFRSIERLEGFVILTAFNDRCFLLPDRVFASQDELGRFTEACMAWNAQAGGVDRAMVKLLASTHLACPACGYGLRGVSEARCPECGRRVVESDFATIIPPALVKRLLRKRRD